MGNKEYNSSEYFAQGFRDYLEERYRAAWGGKLGVKHLGGPVQRVVGVFAGFNFDLEFYKKPEKSSLHLEGRLGDVGFNRSVRVERSKTGRASSNMFDKIYGFLLETARKQSTDSE